MISKPTDIMNPSLNKMNYFEFPYPILNIFILNHLQITNYTISLEYLYLDHIMRRNNS